MFNLDDAAALQEAHDNQDDGNHEEDVNQAAQGVGGDET